MDKENELLPLESEENLIQDEEIIETEGEEIKKKKDDGLVGIFTYQLIVVISFVIILLIANLFYPGVFKTAKGILKEYSGNDFSFSDRVYDAVGNAITYLNELEPVDVSPDELRKINAETDEASAEGMGGESVKAKENSVPSFATLSAVKYNGRAIFPLENYHKSSDFGFRENPFTGETEFHIGLDLGADEGEKVKATAGGTVVESDFNKTLGNHVIIRHSDGFFTIYGHLSKRNVSRNDRVNGGEVIGKVGSSGASTGNHLHFAAKFSGKYFDPLWLFPDLKADEL